MIHLPTSAGSNATSTRESGCRPLAVRKFEEVIAGIDVAIDVSQLHAVQCPVLRKRRDGTHQHEGSCNRAYDTNLRCHGSVLSLTLHHCSARDFASGEAFSRPSIQLSIHRVFAAATAALRAASNSSPGSQRGKSSEFATTKPTKKPSCASSTMPSNTQLSSIWSDGRCVCFSYSFCCRLLQAAALPMKSVPVCRHTAGTPILAKLNWSER